MGGVVYNYGGGVGRVVIGVMLGWGVIVMGGVG